MLNLLSRPAAKRKPLFQLMQKQDIWRVYSGELRIKGTHQAIFLMEPNVKTAENIAITGSRFWNNFIFKIRFNIKSDSIKPPEGGTIFYFHFNNLRNFYSIHCGVCKRKVEFIKRIRGRWQVVAGKNYNFNKDSPYSFTITSKSGYHQCRINGENLLSVTDTDIQAGFVGIGTKLCDTEFSRVSISFF